MLYVLPTAIGFLQEDDEHPEGMSMSSMSMMRHHCISRGLLVTGSGADGCR